MPYLIDGHNLIPNIPGLSLNMMDDEIQLVQLLQEFCRVERKQAEVYFDQASPGQSGTRRYGQVRAHFVRQGTPADAAIARRLARLGNSAANWIVVSSDSAVQRAARAARAQVIGADRFARLILHSQQGTSVPAGEDRPLGVSPDELTEWLELFGGEDGSNY